MKIEIKNRWNFEVIFAYECEDNTIAITLKAAINAKTNLRSADLRSANLRSADLRSANLYGADLGEFGKLTGNRPFFQVGPIGSREDNLLAFLTENGVYLRAGCFFGTVEEFNSKLSAEHDMNKHAQEYRAALALISTHFEIWGAK